MKRRNFIAASAAAAVSLAAPALRAQSALPGPVKILVGFPPGGGTDALARVLAPKLSTMWGVPVVIENRGGAAGVIAADLAAKSPSDGSVLLMAHINSHALAPALGTKLSYSVEKDFTPITLVGVTPNLLICNNDQPAKTVKDIVELCRKNPGKISFASAGGGSAQHFALEMFKLRAGIDALHVPYKGSGPALTDLIGGQVNYCFETMTSAQPHVKGGKAIAIAQTRTKRSKAFPNVPTVAELGFPGFDATTWYGLMAPGKLNPALAKRMNEDVNKALAMADVAEKLEQFGAEDGGGSAEKFSEFIRSETVKWTQVAKDANVKADA